MNPAGTHGIQTRMAAWRLKNPQRVSKANEREARLTMARDRALGATDRQKVERSRRRAAVKQATPVWADRPQITSIYAEATKKMISTGVPYHVDHIIPLNHPLVCGLHVPGNLQVLKGEDNDKKGQKLVSTDQQLSYIIHRGRF